jgi:hypothetical protein
VDERAVGAQEAVRVNPYPRRKGTLLMGLRKDPLNMNSLFDILKDVILTFV